MHDASTFSGLDPEYARAASGRMDASAAQLGSLISNIAGLLDSVQWEGPNARRFASDWSGSFGGQLRMAQESLTENAAELRRRAEMQEEASA